MNESIGEDAALEWVGERGYAVGWLNTSIPDGAWATNKECLSVPRRIARGLRL